MSFCLVSTLPLGIFLLLELESLNFAYNSISIIPNEIRNLRKLQFLNAEGNELFALPQGLLKLHLKQIRLEGNFLHPLLWKENSQNKPQKLSHLAARVFTRNNLQQHYTDIPKDIQNILNRATVCDCCGGPMYGSGLRIIRPCRKIFGIENLPFLFHSCSPSCKAHFMMQTESLINVIYH
ncbi:leucine-rich repeat-containing protein 63 isoform X1 [Callorhinchus milii]|uniref:leucine-rich repeat-containing protein 63 isoform X1 n=1 Tax=Callorhinchus milii TaxID=7868 RepID=UPI00045742A8|nr:leucine-rich repeat-containing protein 63 isoform X1 [Callorhinchus milii]|eukprot:gi/632949052/ref/XP_007889934.1/ PREDICTED: leucine-rich repeat-containing protein 63 isoform X1 [Callorhinchus milii]